MSQGPALQYDLSKLEEESWRFAEFFDFTGTVMCWAGLRRYSAVEKEGQRFARIQCSYFDDFTLFQHFFSTAVGTGSESCFHWIRIACLWKRLGVGAEKGSVP